MLVKHIHKSIAAHSSVTCRGSYLLFSVKEIILLSQQEQYTLLRSEGFYRSIPTNYATGIMSIRMKAKWSGCVYFPLTQRSLVE